MTVADRVTDNVHLVAVLELSRAQHMSSTAGVKISIFLDSFSFSHVALNDSIICIYHIWHLYITILEKIENGQSCG